MQKHNKNSKNSCGNILNNILNRVDLFGILPQFTILNREKFTSKIGFFSSLIVVGICFSYFLLQIKALVERQNPSVVQYDTQLLESHEIPLLMSNFSLAITLAGANTLPIDRKYFTVTIENCARVKVKDLVSNQTTVELSCITYPTETCTQDHFITQVQKNYIENIYLSSTICIQRQAWQANPPKLQGVVSSSVYKFITVSLSVCQNSTDYNECPPMEEIQKNMKSGYYAVLMSDNLLNMDNPTNPINQMMLVQTTPFSISTSRSIHQTFKIIDSISDFGLITQEQHVVEGLIQNQWSETSEYYNQAFLIKQQITLDVRRSNYFRNYIKLQSILGYVGGLLNILVLIFKVLLTPIVQQMMNITLANKLFRFESHITTKVIKYQAVDLIERKKIPQQSLSITNRWKQKYQNCEILKNNDKFETMTPKKTNTQINLLDVLSLTFGCKKKLKYQLNFAKQNFSQKLDIAFIIRKLYELDKMKYILFSNDQLGLFNFLPKPVIPAAKILNKEVQDKVHNFQQQKLYKFILEDEISKSVKLEKAYESYKSIQTKEHKSAIDHQLLECLDEDLIFLFQKLMQDEKDQQINEEFEALGEREKHITQRPILIRKAD